MVSEVNFPGKTSLVGRESDSFYRDAFLVNSRRRNSSAKYVYHSIFAYCPNLILNVFDFINRIAKKLRFSGISCPVYFEYNAIYKGKKIGLITFDEISNSEVIVVANEKNMDIWVSVLKVTDTQFIVSTLINFKNQKGRIYMRLIKPLHQMLTKFSIKQALKARRL